MFQCSGNTAQHPLDFHASQTEVYKPADQVFAEHEI